MSAAETADEIKVAAPAAIINLTLRICFALLSGEADSTPHMKNSRPERSHQMLKRHLTLIIKVDDF